MSRSPGMNRPEYSSSVFVNCPFDLDYLPLFRALIFTIESCGFSARCALEIEDSGETRVNKILRLIGDSRLGIHDISRTEISAAGLPRFNMPYEFGLFTGFKYAGNSKQRKKAILVLDRMPYRYQQYLSDIAGQDIKSHGGQVEQLIRVVRDWLRYQTRRAIFGSQSIHRNYVQFCEDLQSLLIRKSLTETDLLNYLDLHSCITQWIAENAG